MTGRTIGEKILSAKCGHEVRAGDIVVARVDCILGTDASAPMAFDYFGQLGASRLFDPSRTFFSLDHYSPPTTPGTAAFHEEIRAFATRHGAHVFEMGEGISHQVVVERGIVRAGDLVVGADSHTVTCGALNLFATGVGSLDLAAAMMTGRIWLRVPETIQVVLNGQRPAGLSAKDIALALVSLIGADGANNQALEFSGPALDALPLADRMVLCNLAVEMGADAAICPGPIAPDPGATYARTVAVDITDLTQQIARPHAPDNVTPLESAVGIPVQMVFLGTCTGGRVGDFHDAMAVLERGGGRIAPGVQLVVTPASRDVERQLEADGTLAKFRAMGAEITAPGCGACCGTSGVIPGDKATVISTANRNFKGRMGNATAAIYLASPAACAAAAVTGRITDPVSIGAHAGTG